jgi:AcrR family transcriptional regulator
VTPETERQLRADARRNHERITAAAGDLFARRGRDAQMEDIAARAGVGMATLYRHFANKQALLTAMVRERYQGMADLARAAEEIADPGEAFETLLRTYLEAAEGDAAFQLALLGSRDLEWEGIAQQKAEFAAIVARVIDRAVGTGALRGDLTIADFPLLTCGAMSAMYFRPGGNGDWRRQLELALEGLRPATATRCPAGSRGGADADRPRP